MDRTRQQQRVSDPYIQPTPQEASPAADLPELPFLLIRGDLLFRLQRAIGLIPPDGLGVVRRAIVFALFAWLPIAAWAALYGRLFPGVASEPLLQHFGVHVRCLVAIPLLILGEAMAQGTVRRLIPQFVRSGLISQESRAQFVDILQHAARLRDNSFPWVIGAGIVISWAVVSPASWNAHEILWADEPAASGLRLGFGGWWFLYVARPLFTALLFAWVWRLVLVTSLLWRIARLDLALVPTHPDKAGGLGFLEGLPLAFTPFALALSSVLAARWAHDLLYHQVPVDSLKFPLALFVVLILGLLLAPLAVFAPRLAAAKRRALLEYGALVAEHGRLVRRRWILQEKVENEELLQAPELGPVADTVSLYEAVTRTRPAPIGKRALAAVLIPVLLPMLAAAAVQVPIKDMVIKLLGVLL
jgi:hypothetical protein